MKYPRRFLVTWLVLAIGISISRIPSKPIVLPKEAHNTIGDNPVLEQFDDGYVNQIEGKPYHAKASKGSMDNGDSDSHLSYNYFYFPPSDMD